MKKFILAVGSLLILLGTKAQPTMKTATFDLDAADLNIGWKVVDAGVEDGDIFVTYGKPVCNMSKDKDFFSTTYVYKGVAWDLHKVRFNQDLTYKTTDKLSFETTREAMKEAPVFGKYFIPTPTTTISGSLLKGSGGLGTKLCTGDYIGTRVVAADVALTGFKVSISRIDTDIRTFTDKRTGKPLEVCSEIPVFALISSEPAKEQKGQKWIPLFSDPVPNGGHILFATSGVYNEPGKAHIVFRKYDQNATVIKELVFTTDYYGIAATNLIPLEDGGFDYAIVLRSVDYKDKQNLGSRDALFAEYLRVDGRTMELKERVEFTLQTTDWLVEKVIEKDGAVYLMGPAGSTTKKSTYTQYRSTKDLTNYQIAKIVNQKAEFVTSNTTDDFEKVAQLVPGIKGKASPITTLMTRNDWSEYKVVNNRLFITGQQTVTDKYGFNGTNDAMTVWAFDEKGKITGAFLKPEESFAETDILFNKDGSKLYWAIYDYDVWNKAEGAMFTPKAYNIVAPQLQIAVINTLTNKLEGFKIYGEEEYAVAMNSELLFDSETHVGFTGRSLTKKAKDSDLVIITFEK